MVPTTTKTKSSSDYESSAAKRTKSSSPILRLTIKVLKSRRDRNLENLNSEYLFKFLHKKISDQAGMSFGDNRLAQMQLLMAFMREDATFLIIMQEMERIRSNDYLLDSKTSSELHNMILERIKLAMEVEFHRMKRLWEGSMGLLC